MEQLVPWVGISLAVLGSSEAGMVSKTSHSSGPKVLWHSLVPLPSHKLPQALNNFKGPKDHHAGQRLFYPVQLLRSELGEVDVSNTEVDLYLIPQVGFLEKLPLR